jgi:arylsulfatase A-like enzyme
VVLVVWDGMRPDMVTEQNAPTLWKLARDGVTFRNHHSAYLTATNVNGAVMATGKFPGTSGLIANVEFRPHIDATSPFDTADSEDIARSEEAHHPYLAVDTVPEILHKAGKRTAIAGTKTVATVFDRVPKNSASDFPVLAMGRARPAELATALRDSLGEFPRKQTPNTPQDGWTTDALLKSMWKEGVPEFSLLWLSDPDFAQHDTAPGSPEALAGLKSSDAQLARVLAALGAKGVRDSTDVLVVSDHGFSTVSRSVDVPELLNAAGFNAVKKLSEGAERGTILVVGNGGTVLFYVVDHDPETTRRLVEWLQQSDFAGVIFAREKLEGAFTLADAHLDKDGAPDVVMAFPWTENANEFGVPGSITADWQRAPGKGTHATLSRFDVHNTLIAAGPDFRRDYTDELPTGNIDVAPTVLHILGVPPTGKLDGRILTEALTAGMHDTPEPTTRSLEAARALPSARWQQHLKLSRVGDVEYIDEGNGGALRDAAR